MKVLYSDQGIFTGGLSIFLAGPTPRKPEVPSWRPEAIKILESFAFNGTVLVPERVGGWAKANYDDQVDWERAGLALATKIVFWVPRDMATMPALTTNVEFGYWVAKSSERVLYGRPDSAPSTKYLDWLLSLEDSQATIYNDLRTLLKDAAGYATFMHENT